MAAAVRLTHFAPIIIRFVWAVSCCLLALSSCSNHTHGIGEWGFASDPCECYRYAHNFTFFFTFTFLTFWGHCIMSTVRAF